VGLPEVSTREIGGTPLLSTKTARPSGGAKPQTPRVFVHCTNMKTPQHPSDQPESISKRGIRLGNPGWYVMRSVRSDARWNKVCRVSVMPGRPFSGQFCASSPRRSYTGGLSTTLRSSPRRAARNTSASGTPRDRANPRKATSLPPSSPYQSRAEGLPMGMPCCPIQGDHGGDGGVDLLG